MLPISLSVLITILWLTRSRGPSHRHSPPKLVASSKDLPVEPPAHLPSHIEENGKSTKPLRTLTQTQDCGTSESDDKEEGPRHWLWIPRETPRVKNTIPHQRVTIERQNHSEQTWVYIRESSCWASIWLFIHFKFQQQPECPHQNVQEKHWILHAKSQFVSKWDMQRYGIVIIQCV